MVSFVESLPSGIGNFSMRWDLVNLGRSPKPLSFHVSRNTCKIQNKQIRDTTVLQKAPPTVHYKSKAQFLQYFKDGYSACCFLMSF